MKQESIKTILAGGALVALLALAGPAPADAAAGPGGLWGWLAGFWGERTAAPWVGTGQGVPRSTGTAAGWEKVGSAVDPNGGSAQAAATTSSGCALRNGAGICLDPKG